MATINFRIVSQVKLEIRPTHLPFSIILVRYPSDMFLREVLYPVIYQRDYVFSDSMDPLVFRCVIIGKQKCKQTLHITWEIMMLAT